MIILVATEKPFAKEAINGIKEICDTGGHELLLLEKYTNRKELVDAVKDVNAIIVRSDVIDKGVFDAAKNLKIVVRAGSGYDNIDLEAASANDVCVMNTPGQNSNAVAELAIALMIYLKRNGFDGSTGTELKGKKLGLHGFGNIGKIVTHIAKGFGMRVYAYSPSLSNNLERELKYGVIGVKTPEELYDNSDIVSLHIPVNFDTKKSINYNLMKRLPMDGIIINTARKEIVNEVDMMRIMTERVNLKYATDIKPNNHDEMVKKFENRYFASRKKSGAQTSEANINAGLAAAQQVLDFFKSGDEQFRVNK